VAAFVRISAVLVGMANMFLLSLAGDGELGRAFVLNLDPWWPHNFLYALAAVFAGLLVSSITLRFAQRELEGSSFARYGVMVLAICLGGAVLSVLLRASDILFDEREPMPQGLEILYDIALPAVAGGIVGLIEGVYLAFPLSWLLGMFGDRTAERAES
jgi:hypothetical protein